MGRLIEGVWTADAVDPEHRGRFVRPDSVFRCEGLDGSGSGTRAQPGRFRLYVSLACPWAHRTMIARALLGLEDAISVSSVHWRMGDDGWAFRDGYTDPEGDRRFLRELYVDADPKYTGRVTVPVLWDRQSRAIACNESAEILRILNTDFRPFARTELDLYPEPLREEIDAVNARVYRDVNNGVYRAGFARTQEAYLEAVHPLFETLAWLEDRLEGRRWVVGDQLTEADIRLFTTAIRFDPIYVSHFKCSHKRLVDHKNLWRWTRAFLAIPGVASTVDVEHAKRHYYESHTSLNPRGIVPVGPVLDYTPEPQ